MMLLYHHSNRQVMLIVAAGSKLAPASWLACRHEQRSLGHNTQTSKLLFLHLPVDHFSNSVMFKP